MSSKLKKKSEKIPKKHEKCQLLGYFNIKGLKKTGT